MFRLSLGLAAGVIALAGCASLEAHPPKGDDGRPVAIAPAGFRIRAADVRWEENPAFAIRLQQTVPLAASGAALAAQQTAAPPRVYGKSGSEVRVYEPTGLTRAAMSSPSHDPRAIADRYIAAILKVFREHAPSKVSGLFSGGAEASHDIVLTPVSAHQSIDGWGTHVIIRVVVRDRATGQLWRTDLQVNSGVQWVGVANAQEPTPEFVDRYVAGLRKALQQAGAL